MASITQRQGRFLARVRRDGFPTVCKTFTKRADAAAWGRKVEADMEAGRWIAPSATVPTFGEALSEYRQVRVPALRGAATYSYWLDEFARCSFAARRLDEVTAADVATLRDAWTAAGASAGTVARKLGLLSGAFSWFHRERGWTAGNPVHSVSKPRVSDARDRVLSQEEADALIAAARASKARGWLADAIIVLLNSAMRRSELFSLRPQDVDFDAATAHLSMTKNGGARDVPLCPKSLEALRRMVGAAKERAEREEARRAATPSPATPQPRKDASPLPSLRLVPGGDAHVMTVAFRRAIVRAQRAYRADCARDGRTPDDGFLARARLHDCRHSAVSRLANTGALSLLELAAVSGHRSTKMLMRYTHIDVTALASRLATLAV